MDALKIIEQYWEQTKRLAVLAQYCAQNDLHVSVCHDFWIWCAVAVGAAGTLIVGLVAKRLLREQLELQRTRKRLEARRIVAPDEVMEAARWKGDALKGNLEQLPAQELADKFRAAIAGEKSGRQRSP